MKTSFVLNMLLFCGALVLITACSQDSAMQACDSDNDCSSSQYCAKSGGVFFSTDHCVDRNHGETSEPDSESTDAGSTDAETTSDTEIGHDSTPQLPITCDSVCPGDFPVCDEVRDQCVVFVSINGVDIDGDGENDNGSGLKPGEPVTTLSQALRVAVEHKRRFLMVTGGDFAEQVELANGVSIYGGYNPDLSWKRDFKSYETRISGAYPNASANADSLPDLELDPTNANLKTVIADGLIERTVLDGLTIVGLNAKNPGESTFALWARQPSNLILQNTMIVAGTARDGLLGGDGLEGFCRSSKGGAGGQTTGSRNPCANPPQRNNDGLPGDSASDGGAGAGGEGGEGGHGFCTVYEQFGITADAGSHGYPGKSGSHGSSGTHAELDGIFDVDGEWVTLSGIQPGHGKNGSAGGGGGAGGHYRLNGPSSTTFTGGNGGKGGGSSCGGAGATNGTTGGSSIGIVVVGGEITARNTTIVLATGGHGGRGGEGVIGGEGQLGERGGIAACYNSMCGGKGGNGGSGGQGGNGGHGAGGHGGHSIGIIRVQGAKADINDSVTFDITAADSGKGGFSPDPQFMGKAGLVSETHEYIAPKL